MATKTINNNNHISFICMTICSYSIAKSGKTVVSQSYNLYNGMITMVNQVSSVWFDNKLLRKSLHNETNFNKIESSIWLLILCKNKIMLEFSSVYFT